MNDPTVKPEGFEDCLGDFEAAVSGGDCIVGWGFRLTKKIGDERFKELGSHGTLECLYPDWYLVTRWLTYQEAVEQYGKVTDAGYGPRGGFKWIQLGKTKFYGSRFKTWSETA